MLCVQREPERARAAQAMEVCGAQLAAAVHRQEGLHTAARALYQVLTDARDQTAATHDDEPPALIPPADAKWQRAGAAYRLAQRAILDAWIQHLEAL